MDIVLLLDIIMSFFKSYSVMTINGLRYYHEFELIAKRYLSSFFLFDLVALVPYDWLSYKIDDIDERKFPVSQTQPLTSSKMGLRKSTTKRGLKGLL